MSNLTIKNIPDKVLNKLKSRAKLNRRSLNSEIVNNLEEIVTVSKVNKDILLEKARQMRLQLNIKIDETILSEIKIEGRL